MATSKKSSTSKTARVMNLLSKNREEPEAEVTSVEAPVVESPAAAAPIEAPAAAAPAAAPAAVPHSTTPPLISSMQADSAISDQVFTALESALEDELGASPAPESAPEPESAPQSEPVSAPEPEPETVPAPQPEPKPAPAPQAKVESVPAPQISPTAVLEPSPVAQALAAAVAKEDLGTAPPTQFTVDKATIYVNVMEALVEEKANKYIDLFGLCKCPRCVADVKAMTLNRLEPKYVVMKKGDVIPRITLYEGQFAAAVTANLLTACKRVMESPRHDR